MKLLAVLVVLAFAMIVLGVRFAPSDPARWHVDPTRVADRNRRNSVLMGPGGDAPALHVALTPEMAAARLEAIILATPRTSRLAGQGDFVTYITRSAIMGFPDFTSVKVTPAAGGADIAIFARSRFGRSDFGVNSARVGAWIAQLRR